MSGYCYKAKRRYADRVIKMNTLAILLGVDISAGKMGKQHAESLAQMLLIVFLCFTKITFVKIKKSREFFK
jgi:hypothetical protein